MKDLEKVLDCMFLMDSRPEVEEFMKTNSTFYAAFLKALFTGHHELNTVASKLTFIKRSGCPRPSGFGPFKVVVSMGRYIRLQSDYFDLLLDYDENRHSISKNGLDTLYNVLIFLGRKAVFEPEDAHSPSERIHAYALQEFFKELKY